MPYREEREQELQWEIIVRSQLAPGDQNQIRVCDLPLADVPDDLSEHSAQWMRQFVALDRTGVASLLERTWRDLDDFLKPLSDFLLQAIPGCFMTYRGAAWLGVQADHGVAETRGLCRRRHGRGRIGHRRVRRRFYIANPIAETSLDVMLDQFGFQGPLRLQVAAFFRTFAGLRETPPPVAGLFQEPPWTNIAEFFGFEPDEFGRWQSALTVYHGLMGDQLLLHTSGEMAWIFSSGQDIVPFPLTFAELIPFYVRYMTQNGVPEWFDAETTYTLLGRQDLLERA